MILALLSRTVIDDNWVNKPIASLGAIYRSWMPQTAASLEERMMALEVLTKRFPDIGWQICIEQPKCRYPVWGLQLPATLAQRCFRRRAAGDAERNHY